MSNSIFLIELILVFAFILGWGVWEYRKTSALQKKAEAEERAKEQSGRDAE